MPERAQPRPSYEAIAAAIETACETPEIHVAVYYEGVSVPDPYLRLARILEKAGLIDADGVGDTDA